MYTHIWFLGKYFLLSITSYINSLPRATNLQQLTFNTSRQECGSFQQIKENLLEEVENIMVNG